MKIKELKRNVNVSWSPAEHYPVLLAAGSAAQQVDASFSSSSTLDIYSLNLADPGLDLEQKSSLQTQHKFQKLVWSGAGTVVGGCDGGVLEFYNAEKLINNASDSLVSSCSNHNGSVSALDVNPFQKNLLASGAADSEIFIWDLNNTSSPMAPGSKSQPLGHVQDVAWNRQVQHILGSTFSDRCVVWDLRKNEPIMKLSDSHSRTRWRAVSWHPAVATQLAVASEDDQVPVIQIWDLRLAASPLATLEGHTAGVLSLSWCQQDPALLLSASKDGTVKLWNPNNTQPGQGAGYLCDVCSSSGGVHSVSWSPRDPALLVSGSLLHHLTVYSLLAGSRPEASNQSAHKILDSFGAESLSQLPAVSRSPAAAAAAPLLPAPPSWLKRPCRSSFAFGGKLVTFEKCPQQEGPTQKLVYVSQVVSEPEIVEKATELDAILNSALSQDPTSKDVLAEYCRQRGDEATDQTERYTWFLLRANFLPNYRAEILNLLGYKQESGQSRLKCNISGEPASNNVDSITSGVAGLSRGESTETEAELSTDTSTDLSDGHTLIERKLASEATQPANNVVIPNGEDATSQICRALVCGNLEQAVEICLEANRITDALVIASLSSHEVLQSVLNRHLSRSRSDPVSLLCSTLVGEPRDVTQSLTSRWQALSQLSANSWRATLAHIVTHADQEAVCETAELLGDKLSKESDPALAEAATICYVCSMSTPKLLARWSRDVTRDVTRDAASRHSVTSLAARAELAIVARRAAKERGLEGQNNSALESVLWSYASRLAAQGCLQSALSCLRGSGAQPAAELRDRLQTALGQPERRNSTAPQSSTRGQRRHATQSNTYNNVQTPYDQNPWGAASVPAQPAYPQTGYNQPQTGYNQPQSGYNQPQTGYNQPQSYNQVPQPIQPPPQAQPPRPGSVGPQGGITTRSKYKVDPSVQAAPSYNQYSFNNPPQPPQPQPSYNYEYNPAANPAAASPNMNNGYYNPAAAPGPAERAQEAAAVTKPPAPGWNDPPMLTSKPKPKQEVQAQAPITHPLFGVEPPQHIPLQPTAYPGQQAQFPGQQAQIPGQYAGQQGQFAGQQGQFPGQQAQFGGQQQFGQQPYSQVYQANASGFQQPAEVARPLEQPTAPKGPLPPQHRHVQEVLNALQNECSANATNPHMKRKMEDVQRRLENLYDQLREDRLSETATGALHTCAEYAKSGAYDNAVTVATSLATGADFASVASFLPGLKTLLQLAAQLQIYLR